ncbi:MAG TPA: formylmethanofuran dehydrogenase subunit C [Burkholderiaceae bacterium]
MTRVRLTLKQAPVLRVDLRGVTPAALSGLAPAQIERLTVTHGTQTLALAEWFAVHCDDTSDGAAELLLEGDLSRVDRIGWQLAGGRIVVAGPVGDYAGACMSAGEMQVQGRAGMLAACEMTGGMLTIEGDVGDHAASSLPGSMDGMRGGTLIVRGNAGDRFADRMRRGSLVFAGPPPALSPTFVPAIAAADVIWQLLARDLARHGGPFAWLPARRIVRHLGDLAADGRGELIVAA